MNVFDDPSIASAYDGYYREGFGRQVDQIEKRLAADLIADIPRGPMLELGCGTGHWSEFFLQQGFTVTGIDTSEAMLRELAARNLAMDYRVASAQAIPFEDNAFGVVASVTMLEFVDDPDGVFDEMFRVLEPGGWLFLGSLNADSLLARNSAGDPVFGGAKFMNPAQFGERLGRFGEPELAFGVHLAEDFVLLDGTPEQVAAEPVFMAAAVRKVR